MNVNLRDMSSPLLIGLTLTSIMKPKYNRWITALLLLICTLGIIPCNYMQEALPVSAQGHFWLYSVSIVMLAVGYGAIALGGSLKMKLAIAAAMSGAFCHAWSMLSVLVRQVFDSSVSPLGREIAVTLLYAVFALSFSKTAVRSNRKIPEACWITVLMTGVAGMFPAHKVIMMRDMTAVMISSSFILLTFAVLWLCSSSVRYYEQSLVGVTVHHRDSLQAEYMKEYAVFEREMRERLHEKNHYLDSVAALLDMGECDRARKLLSEIGKEDVQRRQSVHSGNVLVDAIINHGLAQAERRDIPFTVEACVSEQLPVSDAELTSLLSNLISNALEASEHTEEPSIQLKIYPARSYLCVSIRNRVNAALLRSNPLLQTTKAEPRYHGIGMRIVETIAQRYNGVAEFEMEDEQTFSATVMLQIEQGGETASPA